MSSSLAPFPFSSFTPFHPFTPPPFRPKVISGLNLLVGGITGRFTYTVTYSTNTSLGLSISRDEPNPRLAGLSTHYRIVSVYEDFNSLSPGQSPNRPMSC